jgi:hypothetical protein
MELWRHAHANLFADTNKICEHSQNACQEVLFSSNGMKLKFLTLR